MRGIFLFVMRPSGDPVTRELRARFDASAACNGLPVLRWTNEGNWAAALGPDVTGLRTGPTLARTRRLVVIGNVRLDNRHEIVGRAKEPERLAGATDLEVVAEAIESSGHRCVPNILGDFAVVACDRDTGEIDAARDAFGIKTLYYREGPDLIALGSRAALLADDGAYDRDFIAGYLSGADAEPGPTVFADVRAVPPGCRLRRRGGAVQVTRYWSPADYPIEGRVEDGEQIETFRALFAQAVTTRLDSAGDTWAQLSGGLDSSSIVSLAQSLFESDAAPSGIAGTITIVDSLAQGDERQYSREVLARYEVQNHEIVDDWMWRDDGSLPPLTDRPTLAYPFYARERRMREIVRQHGGRVLLSGEGADHYLTGSLHFLADLLAAGRVAEAFHELRGWSTTLRTSFWRLGYTYGLAPMLPQIMRRAFEPAPALPGWLITSPSERAALLDRLEPVQEDGTARTQYYSAKVNQVMMKAWQVLSADIVEASLELRYPFLDRRLVEFSLRLPPRLRSRPHARKWILREAMRGVLPERISTRTGKGGIAGRVPWSLTSEREKLAELLRDPILAQLGFVEPTQLREAVRSAIYVRAGASSRVLRPLSLETWLRVRSGRSTSGEHTAHRQYPREHTGSHMSVSQS